MNLSNQTTWSHHRSGWKYAINCLNELHNQHGPKFIGWADGYFSFNKTPIKEPWVGFLHGVPEHPIASPKYQKMKSLKVIFDSQQWKESRKKCIGIFTLCDYLSNYIHDKTGLTTSTIIHPTEVPEKKFSYDSYASNNDRKLIMVGHWLRKYESLYDLNISKKKYILKSGHTGLDADMNYLGNVMKERLDEVSFMEHVSCNEYDQLLANNIVFLNLYDVAANNAIIDCIIRNTPILINRLPAAEEYLGTDYPFFYSSLEEASNMADDDMLINKTSTYLSELDIKNKMTKSNFVESIKNSSVYGRCFMKLL
jgi:hypothetical protein